MSISIDHKRKTKVSIVAKDISLADTREALAEQRFVTLHCSHRGSFIGSEIRIWDTTFLVPQEGGPRLQMLLALGISKYPVWTPVPGGSTVHFTLIFPALPDSCKLFDLFEDIPETRGFYVKNIERNSSDVYRIKIG